MKLITAIAALALVAGSVDVDAQKRGDAGKKPDGGKKPGAHQMAPEGADEGKPQISPLVHIAGGLFGELYPDERGELIDEAKAGDEEARKALIADDKAALEEVLEGLEDAETLKWIEFGMRIGATCSGEGMASNLVQQAMCLQHVQGQLEAQLEDIVVIKVEF